MKINAEFSQQAQFNYKFEVLRKGKTVLSLPFKPHMITDAGLDKVGGTVSTWLEAFYVPILGESVSPVAVRRDSGAITLSQSGTTVSASSGFFTASDVGRLIKYGTGSSGVEVYIAAFTSPTQVTADTSLTQSAITATIWYVNTAQIVTPVTGLTWSKQNNASENNSVGSVAGSVATATHTTTFYSSALATPKTITEIAFSHNNTNSNVFDRDLITPSVGLLAGDQAKITVQFIVNYSPVTPVSVSNVATGYDSSGQIQIESLNLNGNSIGVAYYDSSGSIQTANGVCLEPSGPGNGSTVSWLTSNTAFSSFNLTTLATGGATYGTTVNWSALAYGSGNKYRDYNAAWSITQSNGTLYGWALGGPGLGGRLLYQKLTTPFTKLGTQVLTLRIRKSWSRVLIN